VSDLIGFSRVENRMETSPSRLGRVNISPSAQCLRDVNFHQ
jgi:hypothetical protein